MPLEVIAFEKKAPRFYTCELPDTDKEVRRYFTVVNVLCAGSSEGCGCGFRHALMDGKEAWLNVISEDDNGAEVEDMRQLQAYLKQIIDKNGILELYACWNGDWTNIPKYRSSIALDKLMDKDFYFKENGFYTVL